MFRLLCFLILLPFAVSAGDRKVALVLGTARYEALRPLENPLNDALSVQAQLQALGFEVFLETDRDLRRMRRALEDFVYDGEGADLALVFFAGHGLEVAGENLLLPVDADPANLATLRDTALPLEEVVAALAQVAPRGIAIIDACRSDPFGSASGTRAAAALEDATPVATGFGRVGRADGLIYAFSAAPGQAALDGTGENSPFSEALIRHIATTGLELRSVLTLVQQDVYDRTRGAQLPYVESGLAGVVFAAGRANLPERDALLLAMADVSHEDRRAVERMAEQTGMPLAPLFGALLQAKLDGAAPGDRDAQLSEAARGYARLQSRLQVLESADPQVAELRARAEKAMALGAVEEARALLQQAADVDDTARDAQRDTLVARTVSQAETLALLAETAAADLQYKTAISDYKRALRLFDEARELDRTGGMVPGHVTAVLGLADLYLRTGQPKRVLRLVDDSLDLVRAQAEQGGDWPLLLAQMLIARGDAAYAVRSKKSFDVALGSYWEAEPIIEALRAADPENRDLTLMHAGLQIKISHLARWVRDDVTAIQLLQKADGLLVEGAAQTRAGQEMLIDLRLALGDLELEIDRFDTAAAYFRTALDAARAMVAARPDDPAAQYALWTGHLRLAELARRSGDTATEQAEYAAMTEIAGALVADDPENFEWAWALAASHVGRATDDAIRADQLALALAAIAPFEDRTDLPDWQQAAIAELRRDAAKLR